MTAIGIPQELNAVAAERRLSGALSEGVHVSVDLLEDQVTVLCKLTLNFLTERQVTGESNHARLWLNLIWTVAFRDCGVAPFPVFCRGLGRV